MAALAWPLEALLADAQTWRELTQQQEPDERCAHQAERPVLCNMLCGRADAIQHEEACSCAVKMI